MAKQATTTTGNNNLNSWVVEKMKKMTGKLGETSSAEEQLEILDSYTLAMNASKEALIAYGAPEGSLIGIDKFVSVVEAKAGAIEAESEFAQSLSEASE